MPHEAKIKCDECGEPYFRNEMYGTTGYHLCPICHYIKDYPTPKDGKK